jgi:hypothetical protein
MPFRQEVLPAFFQKEMLRRNKKQGYNVISIDLILRLGIYIL